MEDINIIILFSTIIFLFLYFNHTNIKVNLSSNLIKLFNNPFFRLFSLLIIILITHDYDFSLGIILSIIYILIIEQSIKANSI